MIRIRAKNVLRNKCITGNRSFGVSLAFPFVREPRFGKNVGAPPRLRPSEDVSRKVEHFERATNELDEEVEQAFDIEAPA